MPATTEIEVEKEVVTELDASLLIFKDCVRNSTEAEAVLRVFLILWHVVNKLPDDQRTKIQITCQPTLNGHSCSTDFLITVNNGHKLLLLMDVKKTSVATDLRFTTNEVAQVLRQVQISFEDTTNPQLPFVLTNSVHWSFGIAEKEGTKIKVQQQTFSYDIAIICGLLKKYITA